MPSKKRNYVCPGCRHELGKTAYYSHKKMRCGEGNTYYDRPAEQRNRSEDTGKRALSCPVPDCTAEVASQTLLVEHLLRHEYSLETDQQDIDASDLKDFIEKLSGLGSNFALRRTYSNKDGSYSIAYYRCSKVGEYVKSIDGKSGRVPRPTIKTNSCCTAFIAATTYHASNKCCVRYCCTHLHPVDERELKLPSVARRIIEQGYEDRLDNQHILNKILEYARQEVIKQCDDHHTRRMQLISLAEIRRYKHRVHLARLREKPDSLEASQPACEGADEETAMCAECSPVPGSPVAAHSPPRALSPNTISLHDSPPKPRLGSPSPQKLARRCVALHHFSRNKQLAQLGEEVMHIINSRDFEGVEQHMDELHALMRTIVETKRQTEQSSSGPGLSTVPSTSSASTEPSPGINTDVLREEPRERKVNTGKRGRVDGKTVAGEELVCLECKAECGGAEWVQCGLASCCRWFHARPHCLSLPPSRIAQLLRRDAKFLCSHH